MEHLGIKMDKNFKIDWKIILRGKKISGDYITLPVVVSEGISKLLKIEVLKLKEIVNHRVG